jgi:ADP-heptose:LPS heptosyltransferase
MVSVSFVAPLFEGIERLDFFGADLKGRHQGLPGLYKLYRELMKKYRDIDAVADLHNVLRTKLIRKMMLVHGLPMAAIDKGRKEKKEATRPENKILRPLKTTFQRYADVFKTLGLAVTLQREGSLAPLPVRELRNLKQIGIAPFARYNEKMYPLEKMKELVRMLRTHEEWEVLLFGGPGDAGELKKWEEEFPGVRSLAGKMGFKEELLAISGLDLMVSMDSANMHFASIYGVPVVSIWGGTHPWLGFYGWGQDPENAMQVELDCRPSSVFGNKPCPRGDLACMNRISPMMVYGRIMEVMEMKAGITKA